MRRIHDAVAERVRKRVALQHAGEVVAPVETAADDDVLGARRAHGVDEHLHPVVPHLPRRVVRLVEEIKENARTVRVAHRAAVPERRVVRRRLLVLVKVDEHVAAASVRLVDQVVDALTVADAAVGRAVAEPELGVQRQADDAGAPLLDRNLERGRRVLALDAPAHRRHVDALQPHVLPRRVDEAVPLGVQHIRRAEPHGRRRDESDGRLAQRRVEIVEVERPRVAAEQRRHVLNVRRALDELDVAVPLGPARVLAERDVGRGERVARGALDVDHHARIVPRLRALDEPGYASAHREVYLVVGREVLRQIEAPVDHRHLARRRLHEAEEVVAVLRNRLPGAAPAVGATARLRLHVAVDYELRARAKRARRREKNRPRTPPNRAHRARRRHPDSVRRKFHDALP